MSGSAYHKLLRLGTHPAFSLRDGLLHCPRQCEDALFGRVSDYTRHVLEHDLSEEEAARWLDWKAFDRLARKKGWQTSDERYAASLPVEDEKP